MNFDIITIPLPYIAVGSYFGSAAIYHLRVQGIILNKECYDEKRYSS